MRTPAMRTPRRGQRGSTGTSSRTAQPAKVQPKATASQIQMQKAALTAAQQAKLANKAPNQKQPTGSRAAALRRRKRSGVGLAGALRRAAGAKASRPPAPTGSRAAAMRRRQRSGGLAGALRRARSR